MQQTASLTRHRDNLYLNAPKDPTLRQALLSAHINATWLPKAQSWAIPMKHAATLNRIVIPITQQRRWKWDDQTASRLNTRLFHVFHKLHTRIPARYQSKDAEIDAKTHFALLWNHMTDQTNHLTLSDTLGPNADRSWEKIQQEAHCDVAFHYYEYAPDVILIDILKKAGLSETDLKTLVVQCATLLERHLQNKQPFVTRQSTLSVYHPQADQFHFGPHLHLLTSSSANGLDERVGLQFFVRDATEVAEQMDHFQYDWLTEKLGHERWYATYLAARAKAVTKSAYAPFQIGDEQHN